MSESVLQELVSLFGITIDDSPLKTGQSDGKTDDLLSLLRAAGAPIKDLDEAANLLAELRNKQWQQMFDSVVVVSELDIPLSLPARLAKRDTHQYHWHLTEENGRQHYGSFCRNDLTALSNTSDKDLSFDRYHLDLEINIACGYHQFVIKEEGYEQDQSLASTLLIVTPKHGYIPPNITGDSRVWGISSHLHALRSRNNWGIGDFNDLQQLLSWSSAQGAATVHTAPLHTLSSIEFPNPYVPSCRSRLNLLFINIENIDDFREDEEIQNHVGDARFQARLASLRNQDQIDYHAVAEVKGKLFQKLWNHFYINHLNPETKRGQEFRYFQQQGGQTLRYYAIFSAIQEELLRTDSHGHDWRTWPVPLQTPHSDGVTEFAKQNEKNIEYHQYLHWQAEIQLAAVGRRSMELGLNVGLLMEFPYNTDPSGFENWYYDGLLMPAAVMAKQHSPTAVINPAEGLPLPSPSGLKNHRYKPFIEGLRHTMRYAGAVIIRSFTNYFRVPVDHAGQTREQDVFINYPYADLLAILCLESQRNRCLLIVDNIEMLPEELQSEIFKRNIYTTTTLFQASDRQGNWLKTEHYPANSVTSTSPPFLASMKGFWQGIDILVKTTENYFRDDAEQEKTILSRVSARAHFLIDLNRSGLLPEGSSIDPATVAEIDNLHIIAGQILLAKSPAKILLISLNDLQGIDVNAEPPAMTSQHFWYLRYAAELDNLSTSQEIEAIFSVLNRERDSGRIHSSLLAPDRKKRQGLHLPKAFYRLQLNKDFSFRQALEIIPYLKKLGISHCYVSPFLMARPGSSHGYDIIDHCSLNPEIGSREDFEEFITALKKNQMALLLDIVPNHMGIGSDNQWWMDVLENGQTSRFAYYFDINWQPQQADLTGQVLLPVLGDHYGKILEDSQLTLCFNASSGIFYITYFQHRFPIDPRTYALILRHDLQRINDRLSKQDNCYLELHNLISSFENLPGLQEKSEEKILIRHRDKEVSKRNLARLCRECPTIQHFIEENVILFNGQADKPQSFDLLHDLLEKQAYRLAYWRVAADEINYRRFFDINDLAGLRMEEAEVFRATHQLVLDLITTGKVDGLRVDHPDGLYDPYQYFCRLEAAAAGESFENILPTGHDLRNRAKVSLYIVAEKILADFEHLPDNWPISGTTGYDFSNLLNGLFIDSSAEKQLTSIYHRFIGSRLNFDELVYDCKKLIIDSAMVGELNVLATLLFRLARVSRSSRDFTLNRLRLALMEIVACFPVYRTYIDSKNISREDVQFIEWAVARAKMKQQLHDLSIFDFIKSVLLLKSTGGMIEPAKRLDFVLKFQQYTGPVMAKGLEDTSFYLYNRLLSLNEVGGEPKRFGTSIAAFHRTNQERLRHWPHSMLNSSTHDSKRSEDVRARINVITEMVTQWRHRVHSWRSLNRRLRTPMGEITAPSRNDEYAFYQNLLGIWPNEAPDAEGHQRLIQRMKDATLKACREAKLHTSWTSPNESYEKAVTSFIERSLFSEETPFMKDFIPFQREIAWFGMLNSLSQVFLKLVSPGIPDIYQGNEIWRYCLVDPDNRRPVNYRTREAMLLSMMDRINAETEGGNEYRQELLANLKDGRAKMFVISMALHLRNNWPEVFDAGSYIPIEVTGAKSQHLCGFARQIDDRIVVAVAPRFYFTLMQGAKELPLGKGIWQDTEIHLPAAKNWKNFKNVYSASLEIAGTVSGSTIIFRAADLFRSWPLALLKGTLS